MERWTGGLPLVRLGSCGVPEKEMSVGAPGQGAPGGVWAGGQLVLQLEEPGREKRVSGRSESRRQLAKSRPAVHVCRGQWANFRLASSLGVLCVHCFYLLVSLGAGS